MVTYVVHTSFHLAKGEKSISLRVGETFSAKITDKQEVILATGAEALTVSLQTLERIKREHAWYMHSFNTPT